MVIRTAGVTGEGVGARAGAAGTSVAVSSPRTRRRIGSLPEGARARSPAAAWSKTDLKVMVQTGIGGGREPDPAARGRSLALAAFSATPYVGASSQGIGAVAVVETLRRALADRYAIE